MAELTTSAIRLHRTGGPELLVEEQITVSDPAPNEVRVRQTAIGVNFIDTYHRSGLYPLGELPHGIGLEAAGVVEATGREVRGLRPGDHVAYAGGTPGAYAGARNVSAHHVVRLPHGIDDRTAAAALLKGMTVEYLIRRTFRVERGMTVLWHAAAGGVGLLACQWLRHMGVTVIGTVGSAEKAKRARAAGCDHPILYREEDVVARVREITDGHGVPVVYDAVGRSTLEASLGCLERRGMLVAFGNASGAPPAIDPLDLGRRGSLYLTRPSLMDYTTTREELEASARAVFEVIRGGHVRPDVGHSWPLSEAAAAHRALEDRQTSGANLLIP